MFGNVVDLLQSSGPMALNELIMRLSQSREELIPALEKLRSEGMIVVSGSENRPLTTLTPEEVDRSSDIVIELSHSSLRKSFAS